MISMLIAVSAIFLEFLKIMWVCLHPALEWDCSPVMLFALMVIGIGVFRERLHRRLT